MVKRHVVTTLPKRKGKPRGKPFEKGNAWRFPKGVVQNAGGRPKLLGLSYAEILAEIDPETGKSFARLLGERAFEDAMNGSTADRREIRQATEGDTIHQPDVEKIQVSIDR